MKHEVRLTAGAAVHPRFPRSAIAMAVLGMFAGPAAAATITVTTTALSAGASDCTIYQAFEAANTNAAPAGSSCTAGDGGSADTILLPSGATFSFDGSTTFAFQGNNALPPVTGATIVKARGSKLRRTGVGDFRLLAVTATGNLTLKNATITGGSAGRGPDRVTTYYGNTYTYPTGNDGGAIHAAGPLTIESCTITGNTARFETGVDYYGNPIAYGVGGGIHSTAAVVVTDSRITGNTAASGGGISINGSARYEAPPTSGSATITASEIDGNRADYRGGGVEALLPINGPGFISVDRSSLTDNVAALGDGGGIEASTFQWWLGTAPVTVRSSTFSGNTAAAYGSAIRGIYVDATFENSTITNNTANTGGNGPAGGAIAINVDPTGYLGNATPSSVSVVNTIISGNNAHDCHWPRRPASVTTLSVSTDGVCQFPRSISNLQLGALTYNGGIGKTHLPLAGSPLVDTGDPSATCRNGFDQRGVVRDIGSACDTGAVERGASFDLGDLPDPYAAQLAENGPAHVASGPLLGSLRDAEADAGADDHASGSADEDGVVLPTIPPGGSGDVTVTASTDGLFNLWVDWGFDGNFFDDADHVAIDVPVHAGSNTLAISAPADAMLGPTYARARLSTQAGLAPTGVAKDGEVEDLGIDVNSVSDTTGPTVTIDQAADQADPVSSGSIRFTVVFDESTTQFDDTDVVLSGTALPTTAAVSGSGTTYTVTVSGMTRAGTVIATIPAVAIADAAGNDSSASSSTDNTVTIQPVASLSLSGSTIQENGGSLTLTVTLDRTAGQDIPVSINFDGNATKGTDYFANPDPQVTVPSGSTTATMTITAIDDSVYDNGEVVRLTLIKNLNVVRGSAFNVQASFVDDETPIVATLSAASSVIPENGSTTLTVDLDRAVTVDTSFPLAYDGTAMRNGDFIAATSVPVSAGQSSGSIPLAAIDDFALEGTERLRARLLPTPAANLGSPSSVRVDVVDNDGAPRVATLSANASSLAENGGSVTITAMLDGPAASATTVFLRNGGSASAADYSLAPSITIPLAATSASIVVTGVNDSTYENETLVLDIVRVSGPATVGSPSKVTLPMIDDDPAPVATLSFGAASMPETGGSVQLTATLNGPVPDPTTIAIVYTGSATGADFVAVNSIVIPAGATSAGVTINTKSDAIHEINEVIKAAVGPTSNATAATTTPVTVTILDDD